MAIKTISQVHIGDGQFMLQLSGLSSDTKPTDAFVANGSQFGETDTDAVFEFNTTWQLTKNGQMKDLPVVDGGDNGKFLKVDNGAWTVGDCDGGGSGGGSASVEQFLITFSVEEDQEKEGEFIVTTDKTYAEVAEAYEDGKLLVASVEMDGEEYLRTGQVTRLFTEEDEDTGEPLYAFIFVANDGKDTNIVNLNNNGAFFEIAG